MSATPLSRNLELKARLASLAAARAVAQRIATAHPGPMRQVDTYFACPRGRLKLREIETDAAFAAELIWYQREDLPGAKTSNYRRVAVPNPSELKAALTAALGLQAVVDKRREVFLWNNVRIHLDQVEQLGTFLEFEAVISNLDDADAADEHLRWLSGQFSLTEADRVTGSYCDLVRGDSSHVKSQTHASSPGKTCP